jgi:mxaJ protein
MSSRFHSLALALLACASIAHARELRVCADPDNLPFSREDESGFENRIASLVADDLGATLRYEWLPQIRGYVRKTMGAGLCDVFIGVPAGFERVMTTRPYYRSSYVFVHRADTPIASFDDERLSKARIGVQLVGNDLAATPPGHALVARHITDNVTGFPLFEEAAGVERMTRMVARGDLDTALAWGPQAAWFADREKLQVSIARAPAELSSIPFTFAIAMGVKRGNRELRDELDAVIERRRADIDAILAQYHVPRVEAPR